MADVSTASNSAAAVNKSLDAAAKTAVLTVDDSALMRICNPKALASFMCALTSYFDQVPGSYTLTRLFITYLQDEFLTGNTTATFPTVHNKYSIGNAVSIDIFVPSLQQESQAVARLLHGMRRLLYTCTCRYIRYM